MILAIDVGNSTTVIGIVDRFQVPFSWRLRSDPRKFSDEYGVQISGLLDANKISSAKLEGVVISSVVPSATTQLVETSRNYFCLEPIVLSAKTENLGLQLLCDYPEEVGSDRIATAIGVQSQYDCPVIVVDFGTATTFDLISENGDYLGGVITPGVDLSMNALFTGTALLKRVELKKPKNIVGKNSSDCIRSGFYYGFIGQVNNIIFHLKQTINGKITVIGTGGSAGIIARDSEQIDFVDAELLLKGLGVVFQRTKNR